MLTWFFYEDHFEDKWGERLPDLKDTDHECCRLQKGDCIALEVRATNGDSWAFPLKISKVEYFISSEKEKYQDQQIVYILLRSWGKYVDEFMESMK